MLVTSCAMSAANRVGELRNGQAGLCFYEVLEAFRRTKRNLLNTIQLVKIVYKLCVANRCVVSRHSQLRHNIMAASTANYYCTEVQTIKWIPMCM